MSLANKYRPQSFNDIVGQESTVKILRKQIQSGQMKNCLIFCGSSGCGKTTLARIIAKELNGMSDTAIEIDAASNSGVDNVRTIIASANERSITSKYKVFIIDEAHSLSSKAWQAFLKTIEEPNKFTMFIFCTTEPDKIPETIKNRCQQFRFTKVPSVLINERLKYICCQEGFTNYEDSCDYISKNCKNQMRDAICALEQVSSDDLNLTLENTMQLLGGTNYDVLFNIINAMIDRNQQALMTNANQLFLNSINIGTAAQSLLNLELDINKYMLFGNMQTLRISSYYEDKIKNTFNFDGAAQYHSYFLNNFLELTKLIQQRVIVDDSAFMAFLLKMSRFQ